MENEINYFMGTATFHVDMEGGSNRQTYKGIFKVKCILNPLEYLQSDALYRQLLGKDNPQYASEYVSQLCYALSQLKYRIIDCPDWFNNKETGIKGSSIDDNILLYVLDKAVECEEEYREGIKEKFKKARKEVQEAVDDGSLNNGTKVEEEENDIDDEE